MIKKLCMDYDKMRITIIFHADDRILEGFDDFYLAILENVLERYKIAVIFDILRLIYDG